MFDGFEVQVQPLFRLRFSVIRFRGGGQFEYRFVGGDPSDQIVFVPAREDDQFARIVVQPGFDDRIVPFPRMVADQRRIGFGRVFI